MMVLAPATVSFMRRALALARRGLGRTSPNPMVGAVVVAGGEIVGEGYHPRVGQPHAEIFALRNAGARTRGATLFSTLEPCCIQGRTPPCTEAIIKAGITAVVIGALDPNPKISGRGVAALQAAGLAVTVGVLEEEVSRLNESYNKYMTTGIPFLTLKVAVSLDGKIAAEEGKRSPLSGEVAKAWVSRLRAGYDVVAVGSRTALIDDPLLRADATRSGKQPERLVIDSGARLPLDSQLVRTSGEMPTLVAVTPAAPAATVEKLQAAGVSVIRCKAREGRVDLSDLLDRLAKLEVASVLVEAGSILATALVSEGLVDKFIFIMSPQILGGSGPSMIDSAAVLGSGLTIASHRMYGDDLVVVGYPR